MALDSFAGIQLDAADPPTLNNLSEEALFPFWDGVLHSQSAITRTKLRTDQFAILEVDWLGHRYRLEGAREFGGEHMTLRKVDRTHKIDVDELGDEVLTEFVDIKTEGWGDW